MAPDDFLPLRAEELTDVRIPRRLLNYGALIDAITDRLVKDRIAETKGLRAAGLGRWMRLQGRFEVNLTVSPMAWWNHGATPLWCDHRCVEPVPQSLRARLDGVQVDRSGQSITVRIPIRLQAGVERDGVVDAAVEQMREVADALAQTAPASA